MNELARRARAELARWRRTVPARVRADLAAWREESFVLVGVPEDLEELIEAAMWTDELREYVQAREDLDFHLEERSYHICRAHSLARTVIETGVIAADFACRAVSAHLQRRRDARAGEPCSWSRSLQHSGAAICWGENLTGECDAPDRQVSRRQRGRVVLLRNP